MKAVAGGQIPAADYNAIALAGFDQIHVRVSIDPAELSLVWRTRTIGGLLGDR